MKKHFVTLLFAGIFLSSCQPTLYTYQYGQVNQTQVLLSGANFKNLGNFKGMSIGRKSAILQKTDGLVSMAKTDLYENAKNAGVIMSGSRMLVNISVDIVENKYMAKCTVSADIIEFTK